MIEPDDLPSYLPTLESALARLQAALEQPKTEWTRDAAIQRFEFCFELAWKTVTRAARHEGIQCASPRQAFRAAMKLGWIADETIWFDMLDDRNRTSHTYNETTAELIFSRLPAYLVVLSALTQRLRRVAGPPEAAN
jgi:nucleotidyltransferase substrate binding protein (TIGR01987 family)